MVCIHGAPSHSIMSLTHSSAHPCCRPPGAAIRHSSLSTPSLQPPSAPSAWAPGQQQSFRPPQTRRGRTSRRQTSSRPSLSPSRWARSSCRRASCTRHSRGAAPRTRCLQASACSITPVRSTPCTALLVHALHCRSGCACGRVSPLQHRRGSACPTSCTSLAVLGLRQRLLSLCAHALCPHVLAAKLVPLPQHRLLTATARTRARNYRRKEPRCTSATPAKPRTPCAHPDSTSRYDGVAAERAHEGQLMLTEATEVRADGHGYPNTPGIYTDEQMAAWRPIVEAVVAKGATFFCQLWHCGRASHSVYQPDGTTSTFVGVPALVGRSGGASAVCTSMAACPAAATFLFC